MKTYHIYTDGSHFKNGGSGRLGIGGLIIDPDIEKPNGKLLKTFSMEINKEYLKIHYGTEDCSNPTMEMLAVLVAIREFKKYWTNTTTPTKLILMADYEGVKHWLDGTWMAKKSYIKALKDEIKKEINQQNLDIEFMWIRGHQNKDGDKDSYWNNKVDKLAKGENI